jgi:hypothetical protein
VKPGLLSLTVRWVSCLIALGAFAQPNTSSGFRKLTGEESSQFLAGFRNSRLNADLCLRFEITHKPRRGEASAPVPGTLWASSAAGGQLLRGELKDAQGRPTLAFISFKSATERRVWVSVKGAPAKELDDRSPLVPLADGLLISPFDLQMPFTHWPKATYVTTERRRRPVNVYETANLAGVEPAKVTFAIDRVYGVLVQAICLDARGEPTRLMQVEEFSKVGEQWMLAECSVRDEASRDTDLLRITEAALDAKHAPETFEPATLSRAAAQPTNFQKL